jgi:hypothetical protein
MCKYDHRTLYGFVWNMAQQIDYFVWEIKPRVVFKISISTWDYNSEGNYEDPTHNILN